MRIVSQRKNLTLTDLPLFATDEQLGEAILGYARRKEFRALATLRERDGMPKIDPVWGGRYVPAVKAYFDADYGLSDRARPSFVAREARPGVAQARAVVKTIDHQTAFEKAHAGAPKRGRKAEEYWAAYRKSPLNKRTLHKPGWVFVLAPDGGNWIEPAGPTDPEEWSQNALPHPY